MSSWALPIGTILNNRYKIVKVLGSGGFGITYKGEDISTGLEVAIKEFFPYGSTRNNKALVPPYNVSKADFNKSKRRFLEEAQLLKSFNDPRIVKVYDYFEENNTAYYVMELIDGESLEEILRRKGKLSEREALQYIKQVCEALEIVHNRSYLHRDIKPSNIMVRKNGGIVLIDFGSARLFYADKTVSQSIIITPGFAPPEQYIRRAKRGPQLDIYSVGATLYYLLTGSAPPDSISLMQDIADLPSVRKFNPSVSERTEKAIRWAMSIKVEDRPRTVREFLDFLLGGKGKPTKPYLPKITIKARLNYLPPFPLKVLSISSSGNSLALGGAGKIAILKTYSTSQSKVYATPLREIYSIDFAPNKDSIIAFSGYHPYGGGIRIWDADSNDVKFIKPDNIETVYQLRYLNSDELIFSANRGDIYIFNILNKDSKPETIYSIGAWTTQFAVAQNGVFIASGSNGYVVVFDYLKKNLIFSKKFQISPPVDIHPNQNLFAIGAINGSLLILDFNGDLKHKIPPPTQGLKIIKPIFLNKMSHVLILYTNGSVLLYDFNAMASLPLPNEISNNRYEWLVTSNREEFLLYSNKGPGSLFRITP